MNPVHGAANIARTFAGDERVEQSKGLHFTARGVEKRGAEDVHALYVDRRVASDGAAAAVARCCHFRARFFLCDARGRVDEKLHFSTAGR